MATVLQRLEATRASVGGDLASRLEDSEEKARRIGTLERELKRLSQRLGEAEARHQSAERSLRELDEDRDALQNELDEQVRRGLGGGSFACIAAGRVCFVSDPASVLCPVPSNSN
jgi:chromosome segregation ATPase